MTIRRFFNAILKSIDSAVIYTSLCVSMIIDFVLNKFRTKKKEEKQIHIINIISNSYEKYLKNSKKNDFQEKFPQEFPQEPQESPKLEKIEEEPEDEMMKDMVIIDIGDTV